MDSLHHSIGVQSVTRDFAWLDVQQGCQLLRDVRPELSALVVDQYLWWIVDKVNMSHESIYN